MSTRIVDELMKLTDDELEKVERVIRKYAQRHDDDKKNEEKPTTEPTTKTEEQTIEHGEGRTQPRASVTQERRSPSGRSRSKYATNNQGGSEGHRKKGSMARIEPVSLKNTNDFLKMQERTSERKDVETDKKLWQDRIPSARPPKFEYDEVQCKVCGLFFDVVPGLVLIDPDTHEANFTCNNCARKGR